MERRTASREVELQRVLSESRQQSKLELSRLQAIHADEIRAKDALVFGFRAELDGLLRAAGSLMRGGGGGGGGDGGGRGRGGESGGGGGGGIGEVAAGGGRRGGSNAAAAAPPPAWGLVS